MVYCKYILSKKDNSYYILFIEQNIQKSDDFLRPQTTISSSYNCLILRNPLIETLLREGCEVFQNHAVSVVGYGSED